MDFPHRGTFDHQVKGAPHLPNGVHAVEHAACAKPVLCRLVTGTRFAERVGLRDPHIVVDNLAVIARLAPYFDASDDANAGRLCGYYNLRHAARVASSALGAAHDNEKVGAKAI